MTGEEPPEECGRKLYLNVRCYNLQEYNYVFVENINLSLLSCGVLGRR